MRIDMNSYKLVNLREFILTLSGERHRTFIVHNEPASGKSNYAKWFAKYSGGKYLDLLERFRKNESLKSRIDVFDIEALEALLVKEAKGAKLLIVDNMEFLLNTWNEDGYDLLFGLLYRTWDSFKSSYQATLGVFLITNRKVMDLELNTSKGETRVFPLKRLESLEGGSEYE